MVTARQIGIEMTASDPDAGANTALLPTEAQSEQRFSELEARVAELQRRYADPRNVEWQKIAATIDQILSRLTDRVLQLENTCSQLRNFVAAQSQTRTTAQQDQMSQALRTVQSQISDLNSRLCNYGNAVRNIKNLAGQVGFERQERSQSSKPSGPRIVPLKAKGCTEEDLCSDWVAFWSSEMGHRPTFHRKIWELCYVPQILYNEGKLQEGKRGLGFACGAEPLPSLFAKYGVRVLATDLSPDRAEAKGWIKSGQHVAGFERIRRPEICPDASRLATIEGAYLDMNDIPPVLDGQFDFCWSICSLEHLGSIENGLTFIENSLRTLKPGGVSVHTAEFNINEGKTIVTGPTVLFQKHHFLQLAQRLRAQGFQVYDFDFDSGCGILDDLVDLPPYDETAVRSHSYAHIKLSVAGFVCTSFSFVVKKPE